MLHVQVDWTLATDLLIDLFFMSDIILNFNTGFISDQVSSEFLVCHFDAQPTMTKASALTLPHHTRGFQLHQPILVKSELAQDYVLCARDW